LGEAAWGGASAHLSTGLRIASALTVAVWVLAAMMVLRRTGYRVSMIPFRVRHYGTWVLLGYLALGTLMNLASRSNEERFLQAPIALLWAVLCLLVARAAPPWPCDRQQITEDAEGAALYPSGGSVLAQVILNERDGFHSWAPATPNSRSSAPAPCTRPAQAGIWIGDRISRVETTGTEPNRCRSALTVAFPRQPRER
jgi:hypothetical protein